MMLQGDMYRVGKSTRHQAAQFAGDRVVISVFGNQREALASHREEFPLRNEPLQRARQIADIRTQLCGEGVITKGSQRRSG